MARTSNKTSKPANKSSKKAQITGATGAKNLLSKLNPLPSLRKSWKTSKPLRQNGYWFVLVVALIASAQATLIWAPKVGVYVNALALAGLVAVALRNVALRKVAIALGVIPVANMLTASVLPSSLLGNIAVYDTALLLLAVIYRYMFTLDHPLQATKLTARGYGLVLPLMVVAGQLVGVVDYLFLRHHYLFTNYSLPLVAGIAVVMAFAEEMLLRGLIQQQAATVFHPAVAAFGTTVLYVLLAIDHGTMLSLVPAALLGAVLSFTYYKKQNLILTTTINATAKLTYIGLIASFILR